MPNNENRSEDWNALKTRLKDSSLWQRALFMLLFSVFVMIAQSILGMVIMALFLIRLFSGQIPESFLKMAASLSRYIYQIYRYLTFNTEKQPFPFSAWPAAEPDKPATQTNQVQTTPKLPTESSVNKDTPE